MNKNAITYKEIFPLLKNNDIWLGYESATNFNTPDGIEKKLNGLTRWFTNLDISKKHEDIILYRTYNTTDYPKYDNYDAINVNKVSEIPVDYSGIMGVPITFMDKYNTEQFRVIGLDKQFTSDGGRGKLNGKSKYARILIKKMS